MSDEQDPDLIRGPQVLRLLGHVGGNRTKLLQLRRIVDFPKPVDIPGHPRWRKADILRWRDRRAEKGSPIWRAQIGAACVLAERPDLLALPAPQQHAEAVATLRGMAAMAKDLGITKAVDMWSDLAAVVETAGPDVMSAAAELAR